jgi:hypothetical protein
MRTILWGVVVAVTLLGCGQPGGRDGGSGGGSGGSGGGSGGSGGSGGAGGSGGGSGGAGGGSTVPLIGQVLGCGKLGPAGGLGGGGTQFQRYNFDNTEFPDALCNDGTPALLYFRPAANLANRSRWLFYLQGGGSCDSPKQCAERWCNVNTNFGMQGMSATPAPPALDVIGIMSRRADNPMGDWNHVFIKYCSSDEWSGTRTNAVVSTVDPVDGGPVTFRIHSAGARIIDSTLELLRRDAGTTGLVYGGTTPMPDLDEASFVVLSGSSGGGAGVIHNLDRMGSVLKANNVNCQGATCPLNFRGISDSVFLPSQERLDFSTTTICDAGACTYRAYRDVQEQFAKVPFQGVREDDSCVSWHNANAPTSRSSCNDPQHVLRNHITTPVLVRMGLTDETVGPNFRAVNWTVPDAGIMDALLFAQIVQRELRELASVQTTAEEGSLIAVAPAVFGPTCKDHETLTEALVYQVEIDAGIKLLDVAQNWFTGGSPTIVVANQPSDNYCPP